MRCYTKGVAKKKKLLERMDKGAEDGEMMKGENREERAREEKM